MSSMLYAMFENENAFIKVKRSCVHGGAKHALVNLSFTVRASGLKTRLWSLDFSTGLTLPSSMAVHKVSQTRPGGKTGPMGALLQA